MALRHVWRCLSYFSLVIIAGLLMAGASFKSRARSRRLAERGRLWMMRGGLAKQTVPQAHLPSWKTLFERTRCILCL
jgi:hypothetical protein